MAALTSLALGGGALLGGIAGAIPDQQNSTVDAGKATGLEKLGKGLTADQLKQLQGLVGQGPGGADVEASLGASRSFADLLKQYQDGGALPSQADIDATSGVAANLFQAQRVAQQQAFGDQDIQNRQLAAQLGRSVDDPILRAKLAQEQTRQGALLSAQQGSVAQQLAMEQPMQRLGFAEARTQVLGGLASQALQNRQALMSLGSQVMGQERDFRLATAGRTTTSGGGVGGAISGALGGAGAGLSAASSISNMGFQSALTKKLNQAPAGQMPGGWGGSFGQATGMGQYGTPLANASPYAPPPMYGPSPFGPGSPFGAAPSSPYQFGGFGPGGRYGNN